MPPSLRGFGQKAAARDEKQEAPGGRRVSLVQGRVHQGPYREIKERQEAEQEGAETLQQQTRPGEHASVGNEHESQSTRNEQDARQVVGKGEANQEGREQQVSAFAAVSPEEQYEDDER